MTNALAHPRKKITGGYSSRGGVSFSGISFPKAVFVKSAEVKYVMSK